MGKRIIQGASNVEYPDGESVGYTNRYIDGAVAKKRGQEVHSSVINNPENDYRRGYKAGFSAK